MKSSIARFRQFVLFIGDAACLLFGLFGALAIRFNYPIPRAIIDLHIIPFAIIFAIWMLVFYVGGIYGLRMAKNDRMFFTRFSALFISNAAIAVLFFYFIPSFTIAPKIVLFLDLGITLFMLLFWRILYNAYISLPPLRIAILGSGKEIDEVLSDMEKHPQQGFRCVFRSDTADRDLPRILKGKDVDMVAVALDYRRSPDVQKALFDCIPLHIQFFDFVDFYEQRLQRIPLAAIDRAWFLENVNETSKQFFSIGKRAVDIGISLVFGAIGIILFPFISLAIMLDSGRPVFYSQLRVGQFGKSFRIFKFRSMKKNDDDGSITRIGRVLRATHLDEIPQLWNILKGEMSFVGPRPEQVHFVGELTKKIPFYTERLLVRPGITGWAQLHEPHAKAQDALQKLQYDLFYVKHRDFLLDAEIILKTLRLLIG